MKTFKRIASIAAALPAIAAPISAFAHPGHGEGMAHDLSHAASYVVAAMALTYWLARAYRTHAKQKSQP
jgi:hypothetical protein